MFERMTEDKAIRIIDGIRSYFIPSMYGVHTALSMAIKALQFQQSVVKCKDCMNRKGETAWCMAHNYVVMDDDYCSRGERRCEE